MCVDLQRGCDPASAHGFAGGGSGGCPEKEGAVMASTFVKVLKFIAGLFVRAGLDRFLSQWQKVAVKEVEALALVNSNEAFHEWKDRAFARLKELTGQARDNWIAILIHLAYEVGVKAKGEGH